MIWKDVDKDGSGTLSLSELTDRFLIAFELRQEREARLLKEQPPRTVPSPDDDDEVRDSEHLSHAKSRIRRAKRASSNRRASSSNRVTLMAGT
jgi:hypothetical protein